jgi:hypothetical protein
MSIRNFSTDIKITRVKAVQVAGSSDITCDSVDMQGYEGVLFLASFGTAADDNSIKAAQSSDDGSEDSFADLEDSEVDVGTSKSNEIVWIEINRPLERYLRPVVTRGTSSTIESVWAFRYGSSIRPVDNEVAGTIAGDLLISPAEGSA